MRNNSIYRISFYPPYFILKIFIIIINTLFLVFLMLQKYCAAIALALYKKDRN